MTAESVKEISDSDSIQPAGRSLAITRGCVNASADTAPHTPLRLPHSRAAREARFCAHTRRTRSSPAPSPPHQRTHVDALQGVDQHQRFLDFVVLVTINEVGNKPRISQSLIRSNSEKNGADHSLCSRQPHQR